MVTKNPRSNPLKREAEQRQREFMKTPPRCAYCADDIPPERKIYCSRECEYRAQAEWYGYDDEEE